MIGELLIDMFFGIFRVAFSGIEFVGLPYQFVNSVATIFAYGNWVVGTDILAIFAATVVFWWVFHMSIGLIVWLWKLLPLT